LKLTGSAKCLATHLTREPGAFYRRPNENVGEFFTVSGMEPGGQPTIKELEECRAKLIQLIESGRKLGYDGSREFYSGKMALECIENQIVWRFGRLRPSLTCDTPSLGSAPYPDTFSSAC